MFAIWNYEGAAKLARFALLNMQHRGQQGAGISVYHSDNHQWSTYKKRGLVNNVFNEDGIFDELCGDCALASVHYAKGMECQCDESTKPFLFELDEGSFSVAFDGKLINSKAMLKKLHDNGIELTTNTDNEIIGALIALSEKPTMLERLKDVFNHIEGGFSIIVLTDSGIYGLTDPNGFRPLVLGYLPEEQTYLLASESSALQAMGAEIVKDMKAGQVITIGDNTYHIEQLPANNTSVEAMEFIYFARPDSTICGTNVYRARIDFGKRLAQEDPDTSGDIVIGVPNSSLISALGYAEEKGISYDLGLVKNQYVGRTFIEPTQKLRELGVRNKLSVIQESVEGKDVILIDDSIVRGTTSKQIVKLLKEYGAKAIHLRISSPPIIFPNYYGIDMSTSKELIASKLTVSEMADYIGCTSLKFLSLQALEEVVQKQNPQLNLSMSIFSGEFLAGLGENRPHFENSLTSIQKNYLNNGGYYV